MLIAITGSSGGVATSIIARALLEDHSVRGIDIVPPKTSYDDAKFEFVKADLRDYENTVKILKGCDAVRSIAWDVHGQKRKLMTTRRSFIMLLSRTLEDCQMQRHTRCKFRSSWTIARTQAQAPLVTAETP
jgi:nucleoside-diphosphate-sugar epimerase